MFGDYTYGTEILELPMLEEEFENDGSQPIHYANKQLAGKNTIALEPMSIYWFRWITGHQTMFMLWHILNKELKRIATNGLNEEKLVLCSKIMDGCTLLYEYTGSCSKDYYHQYIRPFMLLTHKAFSGYWALDYGNLPQLIRCVTTIAGSSDKQRIFKNAYLMSQKSHAYVAQKLVPEGVSLLKSSKKNGLNIAQVQPHHYRIYDFFFLVHRTQVSPTQFKHSLRRRIEAIGDDLAAYPLPSLAFVSGKPFNILQDVEESVAKLLPGVPI